MKHVLKTPPKAARPATANAPAKAAATAATEAALQRERLRGLTPKQVEQWRQVMRDLNQGDLLMAGQRLLALARTAPDHPEVLRLRGTRHMATGEWAEAAACLSRATGLRPGDFAMLIPLAQARELTGDYDGALVALDAAAACAADAAQWLALSIECDRQGHLEPALKAIETVLEDDPQAPVPLLQRARCLHALGHAERAAADCRTLIAAKQLEARAWFTLIDLKTQALLPGELDHMRRTAESPECSGVDRQLMDFAIGKALEDARDHAPALEAFHRANRAALVQHPWNSAAFARQLSDIRAAFDGGPPHIAQEQGDEVIFLVGLPRSGTTLVEQVLASHSRVEGASELPYLNMVVEEESRRRGRAFPGWVAQATSDDWTRLGQRYLTLSSRWRHRRPVATDKLPENWLLAGAAMAMLPQARVIDCRRDALETCWSCYKQLFGPQRVGFTYSFETLAAYWHAYVAASGFWQQHRPQRYRVQGYEALVADPETQIRELLDFCNLPFEPGCLAFQSAQRAIRTPSSLQVRQPLRTSTPAAGYGALLDPLRRLLAEASS